MEGYSLSVNAIKRSKSYKMAVPEYLIYSDLRAAGWTQHDAWAVAFQGKGLNWTKAELDREMSKLETLDSVQNRIAELRGEKKEKDKEGLTPEELAKETSKETILTELILSKRKMKEGSKEWIEQVKLIADYSKIKQDELQTEDTTIHFFLPERYTPEKAAKELRRVKKSKDALNTKECL